MGYIFVLDARESRFFVNSMEIDCWDEVGILWDLEFCDWVDKSEDKLLLVKDSGFKFIVVLEHLGVFHGSNSHMSAFGL